MAINLATVAKQKKIKYFLISFVDLSVYCVPNWYRREPSVICKKMGPALPVLPHG